MNDKNISMTLVGCGSMGGALLEGWMAAPNLLSHVTVVTPEPHTVAPFMERYSNISYVETPGELTEISDILVFGVKPQIMPKVIENYAPHITDQTLVISMAAGLDLSFYEKHLGANKQIVRLMPNTPAAISQAMSGLLPNNHVSPENKSLATSLMAAVGQVVWVKSDEELDRLTAISGCGPAYVFALVEALEKAAQGLGFNEADATLLARQTVIGSAQYLAQTPEKSATDLRVQVTSPGGMTAAGLEKLRGDGALEDLMATTTQAAFKRAAELKA